MTEQWTFVDAADAPQVPGHTRTGWWMEFIRALVAADGKIGKVPCGRRHSKGEGKECYYRYAIIRAAKFSGVTVATHHGDGAVYVRYVGPRKP